MGRLGSILLLAAVFAVTTSCVSQPTRQAVAPVATTLPVEVASSSRVPDLLTRLAAAAPALDPQVLALAVQARECALAHGDIAFDERLAVIDYSLPSTQRRLWVFDVGRTRLLYHEHVAHGRNSGANMTTSFSNLDGSHQSSLGLFRTAETYVGGNGYSLRMDGLESGVNDNARERLIVMHGADYVDPPQALRQGRLGRSFGCPALRQEVAREVIDALKGGQLLFAYYPQHRWLTRSRFLHCGAVADARIDIPSTSAPAIDASASMNASAGLHAAAH